MEHSFEQQRGADAQAMESRVFLAHNAVQIYYARLEYRNTHPGADAVPESALISIMGEHSADFRAWYTSPGGEALLRAYAERHDEAAIENLEDMGDLVQAFLRFSNTQHSSSVA